MQYRGIDGKSEKGKFVKTVKGFWRHVLSGDIYAIECTSFGQVVGGAGPLAVHELLDLEDYQYKLDIKEFLQEAIDKNRMCRFTPK